jgi:hypothetical protein
LVFELGDDLAELDDDLAELVRRRDLSSSKAKAYQLKGFDGPIGLCAA